MSSLPRSLQRRPSHSLSTSSRRFRVVFSLVVTTTLLFTTLHLSDQTPSFFSAPEPSLEDIDLDPKVELGVLHKETEHHLWSYVAEEYGTDGWRWSAKHRAEGYRRPSWGGMKQQGARSHVRDNMLDGKHYITTFPEAGFNNEVMETCNLMAVALRSGRIPILAPLVPDHAHLHHDESFLSVSEIFDFTDFVAQYDVPVIDLFELKVGDEDWITIDDRHRSVVYDGEHPQAAFIGDDEEPTAYILGDIIQAEKPEFDRLQCWNTYLAVHGDAGGHIGTLWPTVIEQTPLPMSAYANLPREDIHISSLSLPRTAEAVQAFSYPHDPLPADSVSRLAELGLDPSNMAPDDPFGCLHRTYYLHMNPETEDVHDDWRNGVGAWDEVGKYLKFQPGLMRLARDLMRSLLGLAEGMEVPRYMAVHIRRTDFGDNYRLTTQRHWAHQAWRLLHEIKDMQGVDIRHIVFTTDEEDEDWLQELKNIGWIHVDHKKARTGDRLGWWFPTILDSVILSSSTVFLGIPTSTMSILPYRRVLEWQGGVARFIRDPTTYQIPDDREWAQDW